MNKYRNHRLIKAWYCWGAALLIIFSSSSVATEYVKGLDLSFLKGKINQQANPSSRLEINNNELVSKLGSIIDSEAQIEKVECKLLEDEQSCSNVNTSDEESKKVEQNAGVALNYYTLGVHATNRSRKKALQYDPTNNYVQKAEDMPDAPRLAIDAKNIHESSNEGTSYSTIFCVALRDNDSHIKKFVFHNKKGLLPGSCRDKAEELGYDVIQSEQSHAEGEFLQFLYKRSIHDSYTHIIAMGCSRPHCVECDCLFRLILGKNYNEITAATEPSGCPTVSITNITTDGFRVNKIRDYKILQGTDAVSKREPSAKFFIPKSLKYLIEACTGRSINLVGPKYVETQRQEEHTENIEDEKGSVPMDTD